MKREAEIHKPRNTKDNHQATQARGDCGRDSPSKRIKPANTSMLDFQASELRDNKFLWFKPPRLYRSITQPQETNTVVM